MGCWGPHPKQPMVRARLERMTVILTGAAISTRLSLAASFGASRGVPGRFGAFRGVSGCVRAPPSVWGVLTDPGGCLVRSDNGAVARIVLHGVYVPCHGVTTYPKETVCGLRYPTLRSGVAPAKFGLQDTICGAFQMKTDSRCTPGV